MVFCLHKLINLLLVLRDKNMSSDLKLIDTALELLTTRDEILQQIALDNLKFMVRRQLGQALNDGAEVKIVHRLTKEICAVQSTSLQWTKRNRKMFSEEDFHFHQKGKG
ncbi:hypothetical protein CDAR_553821 [Caerostris darwini]|uniref:Uncharacterized protein n=1 Tax=Caerostris darwini TaxID=1538125 RepID=A0AAV4WJF3_9ARAC|nr:hypothetical protein CDAR_553821 [Caerostris darwini]